MASAYTSRVPATMRGTVNSLPSSCLGLPAEARAQLVVVEQAVQRSGERERVTGGYDESGHSVQIRVGNAGRKIGGDDRRTRGVRLDLHEAEGLTAGHARLDRSTSAARYQAESSSSY